MTWESSADGRSSRSINKLLDALNQSNLFSRKTDKPSKHRTVNTSILQNPSRSTQNLAQNKMKVPFVLGLSLIGLANGFVVKSYKSDDCSGDARTNDFKSNGKRFDIAGSRSVSYQSDIGCVLSTYDSNGGKKASTRNQNVCFSPGNLIEGVACY